MSEETTIPAHKRVLSGMRPTGKLHLGNYMGALKNWVELQNETNEDGTEVRVLLLYRGLPRPDDGLRRHRTSCRRHVREVALDFLAAGLDPELCTIFVQSEVPAHFVLNSMLWR